MRVTFRAIAIAVGTAAALCAAVGFADERTAGSPEQRAVRFLSGEVPKWAADNKCYSCHNNGDAARALLAAARVGLLDDRAPLADTLQFLAAPNGWDDDGPDGPFKDQKLARIQFGAALADATAAGVLADRSALAAAAPLVVELQSADGSWQTDAPGTIGSPVTYGRGLATAMSIRTLAAADSRKYQPAIAKAVGWFEATEAKSVLDAAATLWALADRTSDAAAARRKQCIDVVRRGESTGGGWGPFVNSQPEAFDTALVVIALAGQPAGERAKLREMIDRGRAWLVAAQEPDGGWPPTTRPPGVDSYAQRLSTTAWATMALLATRK